jgi:tight adherence protein B
MTTLAAAAAAVAVWLLVMHPGGRWLRLRLLQRGAPVRRLVGDATLAILVVGSAGLVTWVGWGSGPGAVATAIGCVVVTVAASARSSVRARRAGRRAAEVARACDLLGSLVAIGHIPSAALALAAQDCPVLEPVAAANRVGAEVPAALRAAGELAGGKGLVRLAQAWEVGERTGAPLGQALGAVADAVRRDREIEQVVVAELAGPRASGQVLGVLPILGLAAGAALGGEPVHFFLTGIWGPLCLVVGTGLACLGVLWTDMLVTRATPGAARRGLRRTDSRRAGTARTSTRSRGGP